MNGKLTGWLLVEADFADRRPGNIISLQIIRASASGKPTEILLPVLLSGRIQELVRIPDDAVSVDVALPEAQQGLRQEFKTRPVGSLERLGGTPGGRA
jgi:hypothetical protein